MELNWIILKAVLILSFCIYNSKAQIHVNRENLAQLCSCNIFTTEFIDLYQKGVSSVDPNTFRGLINVKRIRLDGNQLTSVDESLYKGLINLIWIDLDKNQLTSLPPGLFNGLINLEILDLYSNKIRFLNETLFQGIQIRNI